MLEWPPLGAAALWAAAPPATGAAAAAAAWCGWGAALLGASRSSEKRSALPKDGRMRAAIAAAADGCCDGICAGGAGTAGWAIMGGGGCACDGACA